MLYKCCIRLCDVYNLLFMISKNLCEMISVYVFYNFLVSMVNIIFFIFKFLLYSGR